MRASDVLREQIRQMEAEVRHTQRIIEAVREHQPNLDHPVAERIVSFLWEWPGTEFTTPLLMEACGAHEEATRKALTQLVRSGRIGKAGHGRYLIRPTLVVREDT